MKKHYVTFLSPGTFFSESSTEEIESWDVNKAITMAKDVVERYNATPYGFYFTTKERKDEDFDSKQVAKSNMYYLGGTVKTLKEVELELNPDNHILIENMRCNKWDRVLVNTNSWKVTLPLGKDDVVLQFTP